MTTQRACSVASFLLSDEGRALRTPQATLEVCGRRWPDLTFEDLQTGIEIAAGVHRANAAEYLKEADALDELAARQPRDGGRS